MARGSYSAGKRQREADKARKKKDKAEKRAQRRERGPSSGEDMIATVDEIVGNLPSIEEALFAIEQGAQAPRQATGVPCRLFVGGLSWDTTEDSLRAAFGEFGPVIDAVIVNDRDTGRSRGFGFVTMESRRDASRAMDELHDTDLDGRNIVVNVATERSR